ncbi:preprotein translocase subunit SecG [Mailhella massiliensis]|uniref:preprotein translocase subunit SecG n=1 Tax=Mailhella massiliensis TaxID=1903261 RepID=UPI0023EFE4E3|nr:preprotein translocase subunit SecG [Mailhella massiliensis]
MQTAILTLHVIVCLILVVLVLLQSGREGMGVIFGGGGNSSVFGSAGAGGVLAKLTTFLAVIFICTSLGYNIMTSSTRTSQESVLDVQFEEVPAAPAQVPAAAPAPAAPAASEAAAPAPAAEPAAPAAAEPEQAAAAPEAATPAAPAAPAADAAPAE